MSKLADMHMHVGFAEDPVALAHGLAKAGIIAYANTVTPREFHALSSRLRDVPGLRLGVGLHPWWIGADDEAGLRHDLDAFDEALARCAYVGEVGLDFWSTRASTRDEQIFAFRHIVRSCARRGGCLVSVHSVRAEREVLDTLEDEGCTDRCTCILHSYGGSSDELKRAIELGCFFSVGQRMLATKRGREYARIIPEKLLLMESDLPEQGEKASVFQIAQALSDVLTRLARIRQVERETLSERLFETSIALLG